MTAPVTFSHAFQPIVDVDARRIVSYEALLRAPDGRPPHTVFAQVAREGLMEFDQASRLRAVALAARLGLECRLSLNFTPGSVLFENGKHIEETIAAAQTYGIDAARLVLEITEDEVTQDTRAFSRILNPLRRTGIVIAIDDFGAGYAGLNFLSDIHPDMLKLDMALVRDIHRHGGRQSIIRAICSISMDLGIDLLAEGIESEEELAFLRRQDIHLYQGFYFARPGFECLPDVLTF